MFGEEGDLAVDGLHDGVGFAANVDGTGEISLGQRLQRGKDAGPAGFPHRQQFGSRGRWSFKFSVALAVRLFAVSGEKVSLARTHIGGEMLHDEGDGVGLVVQAEDQLFIGGLFDGAFGLCFVGPEDGERIGGVGGGELVSHVARIVQLRPGRSSATRREDDDRGA